jgi:hypothetical protein
MKEYIRERFAGKGADVNIKAFDLGYETVKKRYKSPLFFCAAPGSRIVSRGFWLLIGICENIVMPGDFL